MSDVDKKLFPSDSRNFDWSKFIYPYFAGLREHVILDPLETYPRSQLKLRKLKHIHYTLKYSFISIMVGLLYAFVLRDRLADLFSWN